MSFENHDDDQGRHDNASAAGHHFHVEERELPRASRLLEESFKDLQDNFVGFLSSGLPAFVFAMCLSVFIVILFFAGMPFLASSHGGGEEILAFMMLGFLGTLFVSIVVSIPLSMGQGRAMWRHLVNGEDLTFSGALQDITKNLGSIFLVHFIILTLSMIGLVFFFFPMLLVAIFCSFAIPAILVHGLGAFDAIALSFSHARKHLWWHTKVWMLGTLVVMAASQIPILGPIMAGPWLFSYTLRAYRAAFGDGDTLPLN